MEVHSKKKIDIYLQIITHMFFIHGRPAARQENKYHNVTIARRAMRPRSRPNPTWPSSEINYYKHLLYLIFIWIIASSHHIRYPCNLGAQTIAAEKLIDRVPRHHILYCTVPQCDTYLTSPINWQGHSYPFYREKIHEAIFYTLGWPISRVANSQSIPVFLSPQHLAAPGKQPARPGCHADM